MKKKRAKRVNSYAAKAGRQGADRYGQFREGRRMSADVIAGHVCYEPKAES